MSESPPALRPNQVLQQLKDLGSKNGRPVVELYTLFALERTLDRLGRTTYRDDFVLKGGILLAAYKLRRPTSDIDMQAIDVTLDEAHLRKVVAAIAAVEVDDGLKFDVNSATVQPIRDDDEYTGLRVTVSATLHGRSIPPVKLDVSTGDPIWPAPQTVHLPGILGGYVEMSGHPLAMVIAEKTVTVLQRGTQSTRWRDYVDVRSLARQYPFSAADLMTAGEAVAAHRRVALGSLAAVTGGYAKRSQPKWAAWVNKNGMKGSVKLNLDDQIADVVAFIDPVYLRTIRMAAAWDPLMYRWV